MPVMVVTSHLMPFLRVGKPQSPVLSRVLRQKGRKRSARSQLWRHLSDEELPFARQEDMWEAEVRRLLGQERNGKQQRAPFHRGSGPSEESYAGSVSASMAYLSEKLGAEKEDMMARGRALWGIVKAERALAEKEKAEKSEERRRRWLERKAAGESGLSHGDEVGHAKRE